MVRGKSSSFVAITDGTKWTGLDPATGRPKFGPLELGFVPIRPVQHADLNGDGEPEILAVGMSESQPTLAAFDYKTGRTLWRESGKPCTRNRPSALFPNGRSWSISTTMAGLKSPCPTSTPCRD